MTEANRGDWGQRAYAHARWLLEEIGPRGSTTPQERAAADYVHRQLRGWDPPEIHWERFRAPTSAWRPFGVVTAMGLLANGLATRTSPAARWTAAALAGLALWWGFRESDLEDTWLGRALPQGASQNVWVRIPATAAVPRRRLVILAHLDTHRSPWLFQTPTRTAWFGRLVTAGFLGLAASTLLCLLRGPRGPVPRRVAGLLSLPQAATLALAVDADRSPFSPGANDNAAAVGCLLALAEHFLAHPLHHTEVWCLFTGCEEVGCYGIRHFLRRHWAELDRLPTDFIDLELVGVGSVVGYLVEEGLIRRHRYAPRLRALAEQVAREEPDLPATPHRGGAYGESVAIHKAGYDTITLNCLVPGQDAAYWHSMADTLDKLEVDALDRACRFVHALATRLDRSP